MPGKHVMVLLSGMLVVSSLLSACMSSGKQVGRPVEKPSDTPVVAEFSKDPITLTVLQFGSSLSDEEFRTTLADPVKAKYPNITLELMRLKKGETLESLIIAGAVPDMVYSGILNVMDLLRVDLPVDLNPLIKKFNFNTAIFQPAMMDMVKKYSDEGKLYAMPFSGIFPVLLYNKDIFDLLGISYPKNGMTWEETTEVAKKVTVNKDGTQYKGFGTVFFQRLSLHMLLERFNPKTEKATVTSSTWQEGMETYKRIMTIPGNTDKVKNGWDEFSKDRTMAMFAGTSSDMTSLSEFNGVSTFHWDVVSFPTLASKKGMVDTALGVLMVTSKDVKRQEAAYQVIMAATSHENQLAMSKTARPSVLADPDILKVYGQDIPALKGKDFSFVSQYKYQPINRRYYYDDIINSELNKAAARVVNEGQDVNTSLRTAEETANKAIETEKKKN